MDRDPLANADRWGNWRLVQHVKVCGDKWDLPEGVPIGLAQTGNEPRFMRRMGDRIECRGALDK